MPEQDKELSKLKEALKIKTAESMVSNNKVGEYVGKLLDAETKILILSDENKKLLEKVDEHEQIKEIYPNVKYTDDLEWVVYENL